MCGGVFDKEGTQSKITDLNAKIEDPLLWNNPSEAGLLLKQRDRLLKEYQVYENMKDQFQSTKDLWDFACLENDADFMKEVEATWQDLYRQAIRLRIETFFTHQEDSADCFLSVQAGAGGTEAQDWALMLFRLYMRWAQRASLDVELVDETVGEEAGLKSATLYIKGKEGDFPYGWLKGESGVHRLVRISPFDAASRRHTSFASVIVSPNMGDDIQIEIREQDLRIDTYRASGAGGQHVNKTDSAVRITHLPTGIVVQCQSDRSQHRNRATAMAMLKARLYEQEETKRKEASDSRQDKQGISWGHQIRSYILQPYQLVKDLRTGMEKSNPASVLDGDIQDFLEAFLVHCSGTQNSAL